MRCLLFAFFFGSVDPFLFVADLEPFVGFEAFVVLASFVASFDPLVADLDLFLVDLD